MRRCIAEHRLDAFLTLNSKLPLTRTPCFTTIHGLEWHHCPADFGRIERLKQWFWFQLCSRRSAGIVTFAENTARDVRAIRPRCSIPICIAPEGADHRFRRIGEEETSAEALRTCGVCTPFVLSVCSLESRKNLDGLVRAFAIACAEHDLKHQLVLVGRPGPASARIEAMVAERGLEDRVRVTGYVSDDVLVQLYNQTDLFVYPSRYEGFGLPVLEAMACGAPVVTSRRGSLAEVGGDAVALVDPDDDRDIATAIAGALQDAEARASMRAKGLRRAARFSWDGMTRSIVRFIDDRLRGLEAAPLSEACARGPFPRRDRPSTGGAEEEDACHPPPTPPRDRSRPTIVR